MITITTTTMKNLIIVLAMAAAACLPSFAQKPKIQYGFGAPNDSDCVASAVGTVYINTSNTGGSFQSVYTCDPTSAGVYKWDGTYGGGGSATGGGNLTGSISAATVLGTGGSFTLHAWRAAWANALDNTGQAVGC